METKPLFNVQTSKMSPSKAYNNPKEGNVSDNKDKFQPSSNNYFDMSHIKYLNMHHINSSDSTGMLPNFSTYQLIGLSAAIISLALLGIATNQISAAFASTNGVEAFKM